MQMRVGRRGSRNLAARLLALVAVTLLAVTGCTAHSGNVAAYVDGSTISDAELSRVASGVEPLLGQGATVSEIGVLSALIRGRLAQGVADRNGIAITDAQRDQDLQGQAKSSNEYATYVSFLGDPDARELAYAIANDDIISQRLGSAQKFITAAQQVPLQMNPRYGEWVFSGGDMGIPQNSSGSISEPIARPIS